MRVKEKFDKKLLVEGNDDQHVIWALCERFGIAETFDVVDCEGIDNLYDAIPVRFKQSGIKTIGIIIDADIDLKSRWMSVKATLLDLGFIVPNDLPIDGLILQKENIKVGVWVMPNNHLNGMLEDFIAFLVPQDDNLLPIANTTLDKIENEKQNKYSLIHKSKATIHTWLAWQEDPGTPMGLSITKKYLTTDEKTCKRLLEWLQALFIND
jgi:hypothetical protein